MLLPKNIFLVQRESPLRRRSIRAFTLVEMLMVLIIIGLLAALALPHIRGHTESVAIGAATHQVVSDLSYARQKAMSMRSTVAMFFLTDIISLPGAIDMNLATLPNEKQEVERLRGGLYTHYAIAAFRRVGEQPGRGAFSYLTEWKSLPEKTFFATNNPLNILNLPRDDHIPFPFSRSINEVELPYIAFDAEGRYIKLSAAFNGQKDPRWTPADAHISIARGAVFYARNDQEQIINLELQEIPPGNGTGNIVKVDFLTGRAKREQPLLP